MLIPWESQLIGSLIGAGVGTMLGAFGAYIAIRVDLARIMERQAAFERSTVQHLALVERKADVANERIDRMLQQAPRG
jgi:hypothetical protein